MSTLIIGGEVAAPHATTTLKTRDMNTNTRTWNSVGCVVWVHERTCFRLMLTRKSCLQELCNRWGWKVSDHKNANVEGILLMHMRKSHTKEVILATGISGSTVSSGATHVKKGQLKLMLRLFLFVYIHSALSNFVLCSYKSYSIMVWW